MGPSDGLPPALDPEQEHLYWSHQSIESCRFFGGATQRSVLQYYPEADTLADAPCGELELYWRVTRQRLLGGSSPPRSGDARINVENDRPEDPRMSSARLTHLYENATRAREHE